jgi:hypothetical protein
LSCAGKRTLVIPVITGYSQHYLITTNYIQYRLSSLVMIIIVCRGRVCLVLAVTARRLDIARHRGLKARSAVIVGLQWVRTKRDDSSSTQGSVVCYCTLLYTVPYTCVSIGVQ